MSVLKNYVQVIDQILNKNLFFKKHSSSPLQHSSSPFLGIKNGFLIWKYNLNRPSDDACVLFYSDFDIDIENIQRKNSFWESCLNDGEVVWSQWHF